MIFLSSTNLISLSKSKKTLLAWMYVLNDVARKKGNWSTISRSYAFLAWKAKVCRRQMINVIRELRDEGWITVQVRRKGPKFNDTNLYRLTREGMQVLDFWDAQKVLKDCFNLEPDELRFVYEKANNFTTPTPKISPSISQEYSQYSFSSHKCNEAQAFGQEIQSAFHGFIGKSTIAAKLSGIVTEVSLSLVDSLVRNSHKIYTPEGYIEQATLRAMRSGINKRYRRELRKS